MKAQERARAEEPSLFEIVCLERGVDTRQLSDCHLGFDLTRGGIGCEAKYENDGGDSLRCGNRRLL